MTEWSVFLVIVSLVGFAGAIISPVIKLNTSITTLTVTMKAMETDLASLTVKNSENHQRLWVKNAEQDSILLDHENRIINLERV